MTNERKDLTLQEQDTMTVANTDPILKSIYDRLKRLYTEKSDAADAIKDVYAEAKSKGYPIDGLRLHMKEELMTDKQRSKKETAEEMRDLIASKLGEFSDSPLGVAALRAVG